MPSITIPVKELTPYDLPAVCVVTGAREGVTFRKVSFAWVPPVARMLVVFCGLFGAIAMLAMQKKVQGELPFSDAGWERWRSGKILIGVGVAACVGLLLLGAYMLSGYGSDGIGMIIMASAIVVLVAAILMARGRGPACKRIGDDDIELDLPSADAVAAFAERLRLDASTPLVATAPVAAGGRTPDDDVYDRKLDDELRDL